MVRSGASAAPVPPAVVRRYYEVSASKSRVIYGDSTAKRYHISMTPNSPRRILFASLVGTAIEFFDFYIYGTAAVLVFPQLFWFRRLRQNPLVIWIVALAVTIGMWFERFVIIVTSLHRAFIPGEWHMFFPTWVDILTFVGSCGIFMTLFLLFLKFLPVFAMAEVKLVMPQAHTDDHH